MMRKQRLAIAAITGVLVAAAAATPTLTASAAPTKPSHGHGHEHRLPSGLPKGGLSEQAQQAVRHYPQAVAVARFYRGIETGDVRDEYRSLDENWVNVPLNPGQGPGRAGFTADLAPFVKAFPDLRVHVEEIAVAGNTVTSRNMLTGTQRGPFLGVPATGRVITFRTTDVHHFDNPRGLIQTSYHLEDLYGAYQQVTAKN